MLFTSLKSVHTRKNCVIFLEVFSQGGPPGTDLPAANKIYLFAFLFHSILSLGEPSSDLLLFFAFSKRKAERSIIHINLCLAVVAGIALFVGGLKLTQIRVNDCEGLYS